MASEQQKVCEANYDASIQRAKAIAAKLLGNTAPPAAKPKRKRWAVDPEASTATTAITYKSMELPSDLFESVAAASAAANINNINISQYQKEEEEDVTMKKSKISSYTPQPVAQILGLVSASDSTGTTTMNPAAAGGAYYGPTGTSTALIATNTETTLLEEHIYCPNGIVGYIIGRGGEAITSMQRRTGCKVQIQKEFEMQAQNLKERKITLIASELSQIEACKSIILDMIDERTKQLSTPTTSSGGGGDDKLRMALAQGHTAIPLAVPTEHIGLVIGKSGANLRNIQNQTGAHVQIPPQPDPDNPSIRTCTITCPTMEGAIEAQRMITDILEKSTSRILTNTTTTTARTYGGGGLGVGAEVVEGGTTITVAIPDKDVGIIIGRGGCVIRELQNKTQARIQIPSQPTPGQENRIATITGTQEACQQAQSMIERIIMDQSSQSVMTGLAFTGTRAPAAAAAATTTYYGQQQQQQPMYDMQQQQQQYGAVAAYGQQQQYPYAAQQQQKDYSAEWAAYYAAQAAATTAAAAATTSATAASAVATTSAVPTDPTAYYNDFWKYAEYYGEDAARLYYGAWSPPIGSVNPNIAQKQPDQVANAAETGIQAKDTSVRNVSNLPAWMTNTSG